MKIAMVETATETPLKFWSLQEGVTEVRTHFRFDDGSRVSPVCLGWANETHAVLEVTPFEVPEGKVTAGEPSYGIEDGNLVETYAVEDAPEPEPERPMVRKSVVQQRLIAAGKMETAYAMLTAQPVYFARWFAPDHPSVYCDDPDAMAMVEALEEDPEVILAPEGA